MQACNNYVLVIRDEQEQTDLYVPEDARIKPHTGKIVTAGSKVEDENILAAVGQKCMWHPQVGQEVEYEGIVYLMLQGPQIIALP